MNTPMTYKDTGVDYDPMDFFKREAQNAAKKTAHYLERFGYKEVEWSRGESCYLYEESDKYRGRVNEGLGTKNLVADAMYRLTGKSYYDHVAQDTIAMIVNDMITLGCLPLTIDMHVAAGSSEWFKDHQRCHDLICGWKHGCALAQCTWAGGETPTLKGMVESSTVILSGSADGEIKPKDRVIKPAIQHGDAIVMIASSGIHANGLTMAREIAKKLSDDPQKMDGYLKLLPSGQTYGEALLNPTHIYERFMANCLNYNLPIHYAVNITGHGCRKLMRAVEPFVYVIEDIGTPHEVFTFMQEHGPITDEEAYGNFNMGAGFALYVPEANVRHAIDLALACGMLAWRAGHIEKRGNEKKVVIVPKGGLEFSAETLAVR